MSQEFVAHAFDLFAQEKETSRSKYEGTGLGLPIAKKLADRMGGTIRIESKEGTGTTVVMAITGTRSASDLFMERILRVVSQPFKFGIMISIKITS